jgi:hypothetical protein
MLLSPRGVPSMVAMFGLGFWDLLIVGIIVLIVVGVVVVSLGRRP